VNCPQLNWGDERLVLPLASDENYISVLIEACDRLRVQALFHGCEPELKKISAGRKLFEDRRIFLPINTASVIDLCMNKEETNRFLASKGFDPPKFLRADCYDDLMRVDWFPVVVKPSVWGGGSANVFIAQDRSELVALADYLGLTSVANKFLIQEYVGTPDAEYTVGILHDMEGNYVNSIAVRRTFSGQLNIRMAVPNRTGRTDLGALLVVSSGVSQGYIGRYEEVTYQCKEIAPSID